MGQLPFITTGTLKSQGGAVLQEDVPISIWPTGGRGESKGQYFDHEAQAHLDYEAVLAGPNRTLTVDGVDYKIVDGIPYLHVPHVQLLLRRAVPSGGF